MLKVTSVVVTLLCASLLIAAGPSTQPDAIPQSTVDSAELNMLRRANKEQQLQIAVLKSEVTTLQAQLQALGVKPISSTQPSDTVATKPKRIVFVRCGGGDDAARQVLRAVNDLDHDQWFNVLVCQASNSYPFQHDFQEASDFNKKKFESSWDASANSYGQFLPAIKAGLKYQPDVIWFISPAGNDDEEPFIAEMRKALLGTKTRINTTTAYSFGASGKDMHLLWRIAHETDGICVDAEGKAADEPAITIKEVPSTQPEPKTGSIFHENHAK